MPQLYKQLKRHDGKSICGRYDVRTASGVRCCEDLSRMQPTIYLIKSKVETTAALPKLVFGNLHDGRHIAMNSSWNICSRGLPASVFVSVSGYLCLMSPFHLRWRHLPFSNQLVMKAYSPQCFGVRGRLPKISKWKHFEFDHFALASHAV